MIKKIEFQGQHKNIVKFFQEILIPEKNNITTKLKIKSFLMSDEGKPEGEEFLNVELENWTEEIEREVEKSALLHDISFRHK